MSELMSTHPSHERRIDNLSNGKTLSIAKVGGYLLHCSLPLLNIGLSISMPFVVNIHVYAIFYLYYVVPVLAIASVVYAFIY
jgi:hypothetical protein